MEERGSGTGRTRMRRRHDRRQQTSSHLLRGPSCAPSAAGRIATAPPLGAGAEEGVSVVIAEHVRHGSAMLSMVDRGLKSRSQERRGVRVTACLSQLAADTSHERHDWRPWDHPRTRTSEVAIDPNLHTRYSWWGLRKSVTETQSQTVCPVKENVYNYTGVTRRPKRNRLLSFYPPRVVARSTN